MGSDQHFERGQDSTLVQVSAAMGIRAWDETLKGDLENQGVLWASWKSAKTRQAQVETLDLCLHTALPPIASTFIA